MAPHWALVAASNVAVCLLSMSSICSWMLRFRRRGRLGRHRSSVSARSCSLVFFCSSSLTLAASFSAKVRAWVEFDGICRGPDDRSGAGPRSTSSLLALAGGNASSFFIHRRESRSGSAEGGAVFAFGEQVTVDRATCGLIRVEADEPDGLVKAGMSSLSQDAADGRGLSRSHGGQVVPDPFLGGMIIGEREARRTSSVTSPASYAVHRTGLRRASARRQWTEFP